MLNVDPQQQFKAHEDFSHPCIQGARCSSGYQAYRSWCGILMEPSAAMNELKKAAVRVLAGSLTDSVTTKASKVLLSQFWKHDTLSSGRCDSHSFRHEKQFEKVSHVTSRVLLKETAASSLWAGRMALQAAILDPSEMAHQ